MFRHAGLPSSPLMVCFGFVSFTLTTCRFPLALGRTPLSLTLCKCYKFRLDFSNETPGGVS
nr:MAG TPA: hypothetical protein [Caudoviricetes sp.]